MKILAKLTSALLLALAGAGAAQATVVTYAFTGTVDIDLVGGADTTFSGTFSYDTDGTRVDNYTNSAAYLSSAQFALISGAINVASVPTDYGTNQIGNGVNGGVDIFDQHVYFSSGDFADVQIYLEDHDGTALDAIGLPPTLDLADYEEHTIYLEKSNGDFIAGTITSLMMLAGVPEPASWVMMIGGFGMIGTALRRHRAMSPA